MGCSYFQHMNTLKQWAWKIQKKACFIFSVYKIHFYNVCWSIKICSIVNAISVWCILWSLLNKFQTIIFQWQCILNQIFWGQIVNKIRISILIGWTWKMLEIESVFSELNIYMSYTLDVVISYPWELAPQWGMIEWPH